MAKQTSYKTEAIVLRSYDMREYDRLYIIFSKERGLMKVVGIGTRKLKAKLASGLEPLTKSEIFLVGCRQLDKVTGVIIHDQFLQVRNSLENLVAVKRVFAVIEALAPELESAKEIYQLLDEFLRIQSGQEKRNSQARELLQMAMICKLIKWAGYEPHLFHCANCGVKLKENNRYSFLIPEGVVCVNCVGLKKQTSRIFVSKDAVKLLRIFLQKDFEIALKIKIDKESFCQVQKVTKLMVAYITRKNNLI